MLNKHTGSLIGGADFFFPLLPVGHGHLAPVVVCRGRLHSPTARVFALFFYSLHIRWSVNGLDDKVIFGTPKVKGLRTTVLGGH